MTELAADRGRRDPGVEQCRGVRVPQRGRRHRRHPGATAGARAGAANVARIERSAAARGEHERHVGVGTGREASLTLLGPLGAQLGDEVGRQLHGPHGGVGLELVDDDAAPVLLALQRRHDVSCRAVEVDGTPAQAEDFADPAARQQREQERPVGHVGPDATDAAVAFGLVRSRYQRPLGAVLAGQGNRQRVGRPGNLLRTHGRVDRDRSQGSPQVVVGQHVVTEWRRTSMEGTIRE